MTHRFGKATSAFVASSVSTALVLGLGRGFASQDLRVITAVFATCLLGMSLVLFSIAMNEWVRGS